MGEKVSDAITIAAPIDTVWNVITDVESYPEWTEGVEETTVLSTTPDGYPLQARFRVDAKVSEVIYTIEYLYDGYDVRWELVEGETISQLDGSYVLVDQGDATGVTYALEVDVDLPVPGFLKKRAARTILDQGLTGLRLRAESQA